MGEVYITCDWDNKRTVDKMIESSNLAYLCLGCAEAVKSGIQAAVSRAIKPSPEPGDPGPAAQ